MSYKELYEISKKLQAASNRGDQDDISLPLEKLNAAIDIVRQSFSGSWLGYHSRVYYEGLAPAPAGANFSQEWGLQDSYSLPGSRGEWRQYSAKDVESHIYGLAENPNMDFLRKASREVCETFDALTSDASSILSDALDNNPDTFLDKLKVDIEDLSPISKNDAIKAWTPRGQVMTRDTLALGHGNQVPPHVDVLGEAASISHSFGICNSASKICQKAASHLERKAKRQRSEDRIGTNVFLGHGRSMAWRDLKDFLQDRLSLPWDEFNRVPVAGVTNITRLSEMLNDAAIAFLVMTADDEMTDGDTQARMNVIHEAGLFQGRLGFSKAIVLLEEGCAEFSNIQGLGQIRFPKGNISAVFEEIRRVLEREGILEE